MRVRWTLGSEGDPDQESGECSVGEWFDANEDIFEGCVADLFAFAGGRVMRGGGGAAPEWTAQLLVDDEADHARGCAEQARERIEERVEGRALPTADSARPSFLERGR